MTSCDTYTAWSVSVEEILEMSKMVLPRACTVQEGPGVEVTTARGGVLNSVHAVLTGFVVPSSLSQFFISYLCIVRYIKNKILM